MSAGQPDDKLALQESRAKLGAVKFDRTICKVLRYDLIQTVKRARVCTAKLCYRIDPILGTTCHPNAVTVLLSVAVTQQL